MTIHIGRSFLDNHFPKLTEATKDSLFRISSEADRVLDGLILVEPNETSPFTDDNGETWYVFRVDDNSIRQSKYDNREYKNNYRIVLEGLDDVLWERYVDNREDVYAFLEQYQFKDMTSAELRDQFMWSN